MVWKGMFYRDASLEKLFSWWYHGVVVITTAQLHSSKPELSSAQVQILLAVCRTFVTVRISDNGPGWK